MAKNNNASLKRCWLDGKQHRFTRISEGHLKSNWAHSKKARDFRGWRGGTEQHLTKFRIVYCGKLNLPWIIQFNAMVAWFVSIFTVMLLASARPLVKMFALVLFSIPSQNEHLPNFGINLTLILISIPSLEVGMSKTKNLHTNTRIHTHANVIDSIEIESIL